MNGAAPASARNDERILDAASVLLVDAEGSEVRLLMGLRRPDNAFLPSKWVFPGGRLETADSGLRPASTLSEKDTRALLHGLSRDPDASPDTSTGFATALGLAAVRELFEETGIALAAPAPDDDELADVWEAFRALRLRPALAPLTLLARAITPPGRPRRYDTRFFTLNRSLVRENAGPADGEFVEMNWFSLGEARALDLPVITRRILADLEASLAATSPAAEVPFYYQAADQYCRDLIPR